MTRLTLAALVAVLAAPLAPSAQKVPEWAASPEPAEQDLDIARRGPGPPPPPPPPPPVPVDGGLGLLALAGAGYAAHRLRRSQGGE